MAKSVKTKETNVVGAEQLVNALVEAIQLTKPAEKKNIFTRKVKTPWTPPDGEPRLKFKRKITLHGIPLDEEREDNRTIAELNKVRPGVYLDGFVQVTRRRDKGVDIDYPFRSAQDRMKLASRFGITSLEQLAARLNTEAAKPRKSEFDLSEDE